MPLILLIVWLFAEGWSIALASRHLGGLPVLVLLLLIAAVGTQVIRRHGYKTLTEVQAAMARNELPAAAMLDGLIVFFAGALLIVPGFVSDALALTLLFGGLRRRLARHAEAHIARSHPEYHHPTVIEGEFRSVDPDAIESDERR